MKVSERVRFIEEASASILALAKFQSGSSDDARVALMRLLHDMVSHDPKEARVQLDWLARTIRDHYDEFPGTRTLRAIFCTRFRPADGVEVDLTAGPIALAIEAKRYNPEAQIGPGASAALLPRVRCLPSGPDASEAKREAQNRAWFRLCEARPSVPRIFRALSNEFATTDDLNRRDEILRQIAGELRQYSAEMAEARER